MKASDISRLLRAAVLAEKFVSLSPAPALHAHHADAFSASAVAARGVEIGGLDRDVAVDAAMVKRMLGIIDGEAEAKCALTGTTIRITSKGTRVELPTAPSEPFPYSRVKGVPSAVIETKKLSKALTFLRQVAEERASNLALSGALLRLGDGALSFHAVGSGRAGHLLIEAETDGEAEAIVPVSDFAEAVRLMPEKMRLRVAESVLELSARDIYIRIAKLNATYPDVSKLPEKFVGVVRPADGFFGRALDGMKAVGEGAVINLTLSDKKLSALAGAQEAASALVVTRAESKGPDISVHFSLESLAAATALGSNTVMKYGKGPAETVMFESPDGWRCWVAPLLRG